VPAPHRRLDLVERIPDAGQLVLRDPEPVVLDGDPDLIAMASAEQANFAAGLAELHRVADEVHEDLLQARGIGLHGRQIVGQQAAHGDAARVGGDGDHRRDLIGHLAHVGRPRRQLDSARLEPRDVEQIVDEVRQPLRAAEDRLLVLELLGRERAVHLSEQQPAVADDRGQWRAQLVAHHRQELRLELVQTPQLLVDLRQRARLAVLFDVVPRHVRVADEDAVASVHRQEDHGRDGRDPVHGDERRRDLASGPHPHHGPDPDGEEHDTEAGRQGLGTLGSTSPEGDDDQRRDAERGGGQHEIGEAVESLDGHLDAGAPLGSNHPIAES
jgi:hypothetical protein